MKRGAGSSCRAAVPFSELSRRGLVGAMAVLAMAGCGAPDVPSKWGGTSGPADSGSGGQTTGPTPPPYHQVDDLSPPTDLTVAVSGSRVNLSWTPPTPPPGGYSLLVGPAPDALEFVTSSVRYGSSTDLAKFIYAPRGRPLYVALASYRAADNAHSAASGAVQVTMPALAPATVQVDCSVAHVNDGPYRTDGSRQGAYSEGNCVRGKFRDLDMATGTAYDRVYGASYSQDGVGRILDLGVLQSQGSSGPYDDPVPAMWFLLAPLSSVTTGSTWTSWIAALGPGPAQIHGGIVWRSDYYRSTCLYGIATSGSLTVASASGLDVPGQGSFRVQGSVTFSDPYAMPGLCDPPSCCQ
jgi:hypothetical protein